MTKLLISFLIFNTIFLSPVFGFLHEKDEDDCNAHGSSRLSSPDPLDVSFLTEGTSIDASPDTSRDADGAEESPETTLPLSPLLKKEHLFQLAAEHHYQEGRFSQIISEVYSSSKNMRKFKENLEQLAQKSSFKAVKKLLDPKNAYAVNSLFEDRKLKGTLQFLRMNFSAIMSQIIETLPKGETLQRYNELKRNGKLLLVDKLFMSQLLLKFLKDQRDMAYETAFFLNYKLKLVDQKHQKKIKENPSYLENILNLSLHLLELNRLVSEISLSPPSELSFAQVMNLDFWGNEDASYDLILRNCLNSNPLNEDTVALLYDHYTEEELAKNRVSFNYLEIADAEFSVALNIARDLKKTYDQLKLTQGDSPVALFERKVPFRPTSRPPSRASSSGLETPNFPSILDLELLSLSVPRPSARTFDSALFSLSSPPPTSFRPLSAPAPRIVSSQERDLSSAILY